MRKTLSIILIIALLAGLGLMIFTGSEERSAIIILPGLAGSAFYGVEDNRKYWDPLEKNAITYEQMGDADFFSHSAGPVIAEFITRIGKGYFADFSLDEESIPTVEMRGALPGESGEYGTLDLYKQAYIALEKEFGSKYDVKVFNFDFRRPVRHASAQLEQFIKENRYSNVILIGHSMGGVVAADYIAKSKANRDRIALNVGCGVPYYGTHTALVALDSPVDYLAGALVDSLADTINSLGIDSLLKSVIQNMGGIFDLMPYQAFLSDPELEGQSFLKVDGQFLSYDQCIEFLASRGFALKENGEVKSMFNAYKNNQADYFVNGEYVTELVNSHYIVGKGFSTLATLEFNNDKLNLPNSTYIDGDAVVTPYEGVVGLPYDSPKVTVLPNVSHIDIVSEYDNIAETISKLIQAL